jgi:hypothetical protein
MSSSLPLPDTTGQTFEKVWAGLQETKNIIKELAEQSKETDRKFQETDKKFEKMFQETDKKFKETERFLKEIGKTIGGLNNRFGEIAEHLVAPGIAARFNELGYHFNDVMAGGRKIQDDKGQVIAEIDLWLENAETIAAVEVKVKPTLADITEHIKRLKIFREHREKNQEKPKVIIGAIAGAVFSQHVKEMAIKAGIYVITQSGDTVKIDVPNHFVPRKF